MSILESIILGIVQGLTEFLPISSTAHLRIVPAIFHWDDPGTAYSAVIQLGTMLAVVIYFWKDLVKVYGALIKDILTRKWLSSYDSKIGFWILLGTIPICIFGLLFKEQIETGMVRNLELISFYLIFFGILLFLSELIARQNRTLEKINFFHVMLIGFAQSFALLPGVSRSGVTLFTGLLLGFKRHDAARFSFLLSIPAVVASGALEFITLIQNIKELNSSLSYFDLVLGIVFAFISGYFAIGFLLKYLQNHKTHIFVIYRILLGVLVLILCHIGVIN